MLISLVQCLAGSSCLINYKVRLLTTSGERGAVLVLVVPLANWETLEISGNRSASQNGSLASIIFLSTDAQGHRCVSPFSHGLFMDKKIICSCNFHSYRNKTRVTDFKNVY